MFKTRRANNTNSTDAVGLMEETVEMEVFQGSAIKTVRKFENKKNQIFLLVFFEQFFEIFII